MDRRMYKYTIFLGLDTALKSLGLSSGLNGGEMLDVLTVVFGHYNEDGEFIDG